MAKRYIKIPFQNRPSTATPLSAAFLNPILDALDACDTEIENKFDKANIIQTTTVNDTAKVPSSAVTYSLANSIATLNNNLGYLKDHARGTSTAATINITLAPGIYLVTIQRMTSEYEANVYIASALASIFKTSAIKTSDPAITLTATGLTLTINNSSGAQIAYSVIRLISF
jgi:hypothetical protein